MIDCFTLIKGLDLSLLRVDLYLEATENMYEILIWASRKFMLRVRIIDDNNIVNFMSFESFS